MAEAISDQVLIAQALNGRQAAYATLVKRYERYVYTLALRFVRQREDAHEVAQDSFLRAFRYLADFRGECKFSTWLYKIVYSTALNKLRIHKPALVSLDDEGAPIQLPDEAVEDTETLLSRQDYYNSLHQAIQTLSPDDATVITLFYLHEQSLEEICLITGLTLSNAKTKLCRARQRLRVLLEKR